MFSKYKSNEDPYVIAEIGQNHQGDLDKAREFIRIFAFEGANAVKFQTRNNSVLFSDEAYNKKYESENAFAETYGAHREKLELDLEWLPILKQDCIDHGVDFMSTPFDEPSLEALISLDVDVIKIASFDLGNLPFIKKIAESKKPIVMSIGGGKIDQIRSSIDLILKYHDDVALLHCVSEYPCEYNRLGLSNIKVLLEEFPSITIGSSDHFNGTLSGPVAYMLGARVFEKHVTLNRAWPGTDHSFALEPDGFRKFCRDIKRVKHMMPPKSDEDLGNEFVFQKLGKSLVAAVDIHAGDEITIDMLSGKIFNNHHIPVRDSNKVIGKISNSEILAGEPIHLDHLN